MPTIRVTCPTCREELELDAVHAGREVECGSCFQVFVAEADAPAKSVRGSDPPDRPRRRRRDDDEDDYDDRPRRSHIPRKSRGVYVLLALFVGWLGVHNFYAGRNGPAVAQLVTTLASWLLIVLGVCVGCFTVFLPFLWALGDIIAVTADGDGRQMA